MLSKEEIENKNLLENADFGKGESKSVTDFLETECNKCGNKIKFRLGIANIKDVEDYIDKLEKTISRKMSNNKRLSKKYLKERYKNKQLESDKQKLIEKLEEDKETLKKESADGTLQDYVIRLLEILKGENQVTVK